MKSLILTKEKLSNQEISWTSPLSAWAVLTYVSIPEYCDFFTRTTGDNPYKFKLCWFFHEATIVYVTWVTEPGASRAAMENIGPHERSP